MSFYWQQFKFCNMNIHHSSRLPEVKDCGLYGAIRPLAITDLTPTKPWFHSSKCVVTVQSFTTIWLNADLCMWKRWKCAWGGVMGCLVDITVNAFWKADNSARWDIHHKITSYFKDDFSILGPDKRTAVQSRSFGSSPTFTISSVRGWEDRCLRSISDAFL